MSERKKIVVVMYDSEAKQVGFKLAETFNIIGDDDKKLVIWFCNASRRMIKVTIGRILPKATSIILSPMAEMLTKDIVEKAVKELNLETVLETMQLNELKELTELQGLKKIY